MLGELEDIDIQELIDQKFAEQVLGEGLRAALRELRIEIEITDRISTEVRAVGRVD